MAQRHQRGWLKRTLAFSGLRTTSLTPCAVNNLTDRSGRVIVTIL
jgi:hypothetical protein